MDVPRSLRLWIAVSIVFIALTALATYSTAICKSLRLPVPALVTVLALLLPPAQLALSLRMCLSYWAGPTLAANIFWTISTLDTALITLASAYLGGDIQECVLGNTWARYFRRRDSQAIRTIQDSLRCCGFQCTSDRAWPFPDDGNDVDACVKIDPWRGSCIRDWSSEYRKVLIISVVVGAVSLTLKLAIAIIVQLRSSPIKVLPTYWQQIIGGNRISYRSLLDSTEEAEDSDATPRASIDQPRSGPNQ